MKKFILILVLILALLGNSWFQSDFVFAKKGGEPAYHITWSLPKITRAISPGYSWDADLIFTSNINLTEAELFITPELKPFVTVAPQSFNTITANTPNIVHIDIAVPTEGVPDQTYEGTIHVKSKHKTYPQTLKILLYIAAPLETVTEQTYHRTCELSKKAIYDFYELESIYGADQAREMVISWLKEQNEIVDAGILDNGDIWITYKIGVDCVIFTAPPGMAGSGSLTTTNRFSEKSYSSTLADITPGNRKAILLSPFYSQPGFITPSDRIRDILVSLGYDVLVAQDSNVTVNLIKSLHHYGVINWSTHGGISSRGEVILATGEELSWLSFLSHISDIASFRITLAEVRYDYEKKLDKFYWAILPKFIKHYATELYPNSLIHTDACYGLANTTMADAFIKSGAYVYLGWDGEHFSDTSAETAISLFENLAKGMTVQEAYDKIKAEDKTREGEAQFSFYPSDHGDLRLILPPVLYAGSTNPGIVYKYVGGEWEEISPTLGFSVTDLIEYKGDLYASAITDPYIYRSKGLVYRFEGNKEWKLIGTLDKQVSFLIVYKGDLYAGTSYCEEKKKEDGTSIPSNGTARLYKYIPETESWVKIIEYTPWFGFRSAYVGKDWLYLGDWYWDKFARWNGEKFEDLGYYGGSCVYDFEEYGDYLYAGCYRGAVYRLSDTIVSRIWRVPYSRYIWALETFNDYLYIGSDANGTGGAQLWKYDGNNFELVWTYRTYTGNYHEGIISMESDDEYLYIGTGGQSMGYPSYMSGAGRGEVYRYDGESFELIGEGLGTGVQVLYRQER